MSSPKPPTSARFLAIAIAGTICVLAVGELVVRTWIESPSFAVPDARYGFVFPPGQRVVQTKEGASTRHTNSQGFFDDELRVPRAPIRVLLLGDSYSEALQVAPGAEFPSVAERVMPGLEVVNTGVSGRSPVDYADWLEGHAREYAPDLVVIQVNDADLEDLLTPLSLERLAREKARPGQARTDVATLTQEGANARVFRTVLRRSALATVAWRRFKELLADQRARLSGRFREAQAHERVVARSYDPRLPAIAETLHRRIAAASPRVIYLYIPSLEYFGARCTYEHPAAAAFWHDFAARQQAVVLDPAEEIRREFERTHQPLHGFNNSVIGRGHINTAGHRLVGVALAHAIREALQ